MNKSQSLNLILTAAFTSLMLLPAACSPKVDNGGYVHEIPIKDQIIVGQSSREDVRTKLGSPSAQSSFGPETWYYVSQRQEAYAFLAPKIVQQEVVRIEFDPSGIVNKVENYDKDDAKNFDIAKRTTPTEGHTMGFVEQVLGNIGRFNRPGNDSSPNHRSGPPGR